MNSSAVPAASAFPATSLRDYFDLLKPRVMSLVVFTGLAGMMAAPGALHPVIAATALLCIALSAGGAGAVNMWFDADIDAVMARTQTRPIPKGAIARHEALTLGIALIALSSFMMVLAVNMMAAFLNLLAALFYVCVYTMVLKRATPQNIVIGGAAGALPPMIGWAAVTGDVSWASFVLFLIIFLWTPPHFWALALLSRQEYEKVNVPMLPSTHGVNATKLQMLGYTIALLPVSLLPYFLHVAGTIYLLGAIVFGALFILSAIRVYTDYNEETGARKSAKLMFGYSIFYLFMLFLMLMIDRVPA